METNPLKKPIISIAGLLGSGKTTTAKAVALELKFKHFSSGDFMRAIADKKGISLGELSIIAESDSSIDHMIDEEVKIAGEGTNLVIDSRLAFHWIPQSFKVFLDLDPEIAAKRVFADAEKNKARHREHLSEISSSEDVKISILSRLESEKKRYFELYGINHVDHKNFDLVIDTSDIPVVDVVRKVLEEYKKWINS